MLPWPGPCNSPSSLVPSAGDEHRATPRNAVRPGCGSGVVCVSVEVDGCSAGHTLRLSIPGGRSSVG